MAIIRNLALFTFVVGLGLAPEFAEAHGQGGAGPKRRAAASEETAFGRAGDPRNVSRTVTFTMSDAMRFDPNRIEVRQGETVRFVAKNNGKLMHEMVIGTAAELEEHAELMKRFPDMEHDEPYMTHVAPGESGEIVWQFTKPGQFRFGCLVAGHFDAGMTGGITVRGARSRRGEIQ
jgi:uncharacterized cupredoxin-like copper-binding protein